MKRLSIICLVGLFLWAGCAAPGKMTWSCLGEDMQQQDLDLKECEFEANKSDPVQTFGGWVAAALGMLGQGSLLLQKGYLIDLDSQAHFVSPGDRGR